MGQAGSDILLPDCWGSAQLLPLALEHPWCFLPAGEDTQKVRGQCHCFWLATSCLHGEACGAPRLPGGEEPR